MNRSPRWIRSRQSQKQENVHAQLRLIFGQPKRDPPQSLGRGLKEAIQQERRR